MQTLETLAKEIAGFNGTKALLEFGPPLGISGRLIGL
jgi:hypothetical protein